MNVYFFSKDEDVGGRASTWKGEIQIGNNRDLTEVQFDHGESATLQLQ